MSQDQMNSDSAAPYVQLFQKAHQRIVMLERLDEQAQQIVVKRQELQDELRSIQSQLNEELDSRITPASSAATGHMDIRTAASAHEAKRNRFAAQAIETEDEPRIAVA